MQLPEEILKRIRILADKPISPKVNKQLLPLLLNENLPLEKTISLLSLKCRADLLIHLFRNSRFPTNQSLQAMLTSILTNILDYKVPELVQIWILVLQSQREKDQKEMLEIGYLQLAKLAIKQPNLETKEALFKVIASNYEFFYKMKMKKVVRAAALNYLQLFAKFLIYVPSYTLVMELILQTDKDSKKILNSDHPEREKNLEDIFIDLSSSELLSIKNQTLLLLEKTKQKANFYCLHRSCLNILRKIAETLNQFKVKEADEEFKEIDIGKILRTIEPFIGRKGTIDEAKLVKDQWNKRAAQTKKIRQGKAEKILNSQNSPYHLLLAFNPENPKTKPVLIEDVISMTNNYRLKYQVDPEEGEGAQLLGVGNKFLKKGGGAGGGRTCLMDQSAVSNKKEVEMKNKKKYDNLVDRCFDGYEKDLVYKSFVEAAPFGVANFAPGESAVSMGETKEREVIVEKETGMMERGQEYPNRYRRQQEEMNIDFENLAALKDMQKPCLPRNSDRRLASSMVAEDEEVEQICNLIDLAYSYKFS